MRKMIGILGLFLAALTMVGIASGQIGGGRGGAGGVGRMDPIQILNNASVKKELELSEEQSAAIPDAVMKALSGVLNEKQMTRFKQIELQQRGTAAFSDVKVQEKLSFTSAQKDNVKQILEDARKEREGFGFDKGTREKAENLRKETTEKIQGVLTAEQKKSWREMTGDTFKMEVPAFGGFGGFGKKGADKKSDSKKSEEKKSPDKDSQ